MWTVAAPVTSLAPAILQATHPMRAALTPLICTPLVAQEAQTRRARHRREGPRRPPRRPNMSQAHDAAFALEPDDTLVEAQFALARAKQALISAHPELDDVERP